MAYALLLTLLLAAAGTVRDAGVLGSDDPARALRGETLRNPVNTWKTR